MYLFKPVKLTIVKKGSLFQVRACIKCLGLFTFWKNWIYRNALVPGLGRVPHYFNSIEEAEDALDKSMAYDGLNESLKG